MTEPKYILSLYHKKKDLPPIHQGFKNISQNEYISLTKDFKPSIEVLGKLWGILERRWFKYELPDTITYFIIVDAEKI
jgi:hypothetical protein